MSKSLIIVWQYLRAFVLIYACLYAGIFLSSLLPIAIPGSIIGMLILFFCWRCRSCRHSGLTPAATS